MKKLWFGISLFLCFISMANFFQIFNKGYREFSLAIISLSEIVIDIFLALYFTLILKEFLVKEVYNCKLLYSYKLTKYTNIFAIIVLIILYTGKNIFLVYHIPEYFIMLLYLLLLAYSFIAISTKINNLYMNDNMIFVMKYDKYIEFSKIINYKLNMLPINIYQLEIKTSEDEFKLNLSKNAYQTISPKMRII